MGLQGPETGVLPAHIQMFGHMTPAPEPDLDLDSGEHLPDCLRLGDGEVEEGGARRLHAGISAGCCVALPLYGGPGLKQEVHQQRRSPQVQKNLPGSFFSRQVTQSWKEIPEEGAELVITPVLKSPSLTQVCGALPERLPARPGPTLLADGHPGHPIREALLGAAGLQVVTHVANQERQQCAHFLLQTGSLLSQPRAQGAERGEHKGVVMATGIHLRNRK